MLNAAEITGRLPDLIARHVDMASRLGLGHRRHRRILAQKYEAPAKGDHIIASGDFRATEMLVATEDEGSQLCAETADLLEAVRAYFADQNERRPAAPVIWLVPRPDPAPEPVQPSARGVVAKLAGLFGGRAAKVA